MINIEMIIKVLVDNKEFVNIINLY